jgi:predicted histone-like DNA-binding protein
MSVIIKTIQNKNKKRNTFGKTYPRVVNTGTVNLDGLCEHIQEHGSMWTDDVVSGVVKKTIKCIQELLLDSHKVKLNGLGTFYLKPLLRLGTDEDGIAKYGGLENEEEFMVQNVDLRLGFQPDMSNDSRFVSPNLTRKASRRHINQLGLTGNTGNGSSSNSSGSGGNDQTSPDQPDVERP